MLYLYAIFIPFIFHEPYAHEDFLNKFFKIHKISCDFIGQEGEIFYDENKKWLYFITKNTKFSLLKGVQDIILSKNHIHIKWLSSYGLVYKLKISC